MSDRDDRRGTGGVGKARREPRRSWLSRILDHGPAARKRLGEAVAALLGTALVGLAAIGGLVIWHLVRRGRLIQQRQTQARIVRWPELSDGKGDPHDHDGDDAVSTP